MSSLSMALRLTPYIARSKGNIRDSGLRETGLPVLAFGTVTALLLTVAAGSQVFWTWTDGLAGTYQALAVVAMVLLVIPLLTLGGSAARLAARRRDDRLASLRLLGANSATVVWMTVIESTVLAAVGALAGASLYAVVAPFLGLVQFRGQAIGTHAWLPIPSILACVLAVCLIAAVSAALGLRKVVVTPLGVRTRQTTYGAHWVRGLVAVLVVVAGVVAMGMLSSFGAFIVILGVMAGCFGMALLALNLMGPWVLKLQAMSQLKRARQPEQLLAARTVLDNPKESWRQVGGVAMTSFVGVFVGVGMAVADSMGSGAADETTLLVRDINTGVMITLLGSFLMVACSAGVNQASSVLDRAATLVALDRVGMPRKLMVSARVRAVMSPLLLVAGISAAAAGALVLPLAGPALLTRPVVLLTIGAVFATGFVLVRLAVAAGTAQINRVLSRPARYASVDS
ncbi:FtsX-like permease family protein [Paenarthrobacter ureafaciens]|uniref:FtsX-like permease family protein n=1 Tax=Paenarthrobacter ureafaciens TaxID=37931 RepID=UPI001FB37DCA|nr:FtsX-like permease family protein [Paenarthrobacter ureafaciens]MCX8455813.1 permease [Paenarthrobacter ureafaciens]MCY0973949.1 permease [Paenarthrobacter ureafaciens]UOD80614.1 permease [Paenarthrobacter ureafaciens]WNZ03270.1 permease [Paenarthrobacter ureafaciens]